MPVALVGASAAHADVHFTQIASFPVAEGPINGAQSASGDFNGDGHVDFVSVPGWGDAPGTVLLGSGSGRFQALATPLASGFTVAVGDLDGDGNLDLAMPSHSSVHPSVARMMLGNGDGTFQAPVMIGGPDNSGDGGGVMGLEIAQLGGPGNALDIAVTKGNGLNVLINNGDGTFAAPVNYPGYEGSEIVAGDFTGDGHTDLASTRFIYHAGGNQRIVVLPGSASGALGAPITTATPELSHPVVTDLDGDGKLDIVAAEKSMYDSSVGVFHGAGDGTFVRPQHIPLNRMTSSIGVGDVDGDDKPDIVATGIDGLTVLPAAGGRVSSSGVKLTARGHRGLLFADVDGDGTDDILGAPVGTRAFDVVATGTVARADTAAKQLELAAGGTQTVTLTNVGQYPLHVTDAAIQSTDTGVTADNGCKDRPVAVGATCAIAVSLKRVTPGDSAGTLVVTGNHGRTIVPFTARVGTAGPTADRVPPALSLKWSRQRLGTVLSKSLKVRTTCSERCKLSVSATVKASTARKLKLTKSKKAFTLARARTAWVAAGRAKTYTLKVDAKTAHKLRKVRKLAVKLTVVATDAAGNKTTKTQTLQLKR